MNTDTAFGDELRALINRYSQENNSNTPDFILATYLQSCLNAFDEAVNRRNEWYGLSHNSPGAVIPEILAEDIKNLQEVVTTEAIYESGIDLFGDPIEIIPIPNADFSLSLIDLEKERLAWSLETFTEATPISSLRKLETEIDEIERNIENGIKDPIEYADAMMCLLDSAGRDGISVEVILKAFELKLKVNKEREWAKNDDNSYSHIKPE